MQFTVQPARPSFLSRIHQVFLLDRCRYPKCVATETLSRPEREVLPSMCDPFCLRRDLDFSQELLTFRLWCAQFIPGLGPIGAIEALNGVTDAGQGTVRRAAAVHS
eukprot:6200678-Pleurochrysis_carterae.AAC.4